MAHNVKFTVPERELGRADIEFRVEKNSRPFGTLLVSKGALEWRPAYKWKGSKIRIGWSEFDKYARNKKQR